MDYSALDAIGKVSSDYKAAGKNFHLRFLDDEGHRTLAKGRHMLKDVASWRVRAVFQANDTECFSTRNLRCKTSIHHSHGSALNVPNI